MTTTDELLERALEHARSSDFPSSDFGLDGWQEGLNAVVDAIPVDLAGNDEQIRRIEDIVVNRLTNRLRIEGWYAEHGAEAEGHDIESMLMILGTGRSGTTAAHYLLSVDPRFRCLRGWEIDDPVPPPVLETEQEDPRRPTSRESSVMHIVKVDGPSEVRKVYELSFREKGNVLGLPSYVEWWKQADHSAKFPHQERVLKMLQSHRPPYRWLLKSPEDTFNLEPLAAYYPDAKFVMPHRDPLKVVPSFCSVVAAHTRLRLPDWEPDEDFGRRMMSEVHLCLERFMKARPTVGDHRILDVGQPHINDDPVRVAERIYEFAGFDLTDEIRDGMTKFGEENRSGSRGEHKYTAEEFGLSGAVIAEQFADYIDQYQQHWTRA